MGKTDPIGAAVMRNEDTSRDRAATLRTRLLERKDDDAIGRLRENAIVSARSRRGSEHSASWQVRRGLEVRDRLAAIRFEIDDLELLAGRLCLSHREGSDAEFREANAYLSQYEGAGGQSGHCELEYGPIMAQGVDGLRADIQARLADAEGESADAYESFLSALAGFSAMCDHAADTAEAAMDGVTPERREELSAIVASCRRIAHEPPASFRDAIQLVWFMIFGVMHGEVGVHLVVPGHLDRVLTPFYDADLAAGRLTRNKALELIECLYLLVNEYVSDGLAMSVMVGGRDVDGYDVTNDVSYLSLEALRRTRLIYPAVGVCWHEGTPDDLVDLAVDLVSRGISTPAFFGDEVIQRGLRHYGATPEDACHYINSTCVEITPAGGSNVWVASPYYSMCKVLLDHIADEIESAEPAESFDEFRTRYLERLMRGVDVSVEEHNRVRIRRQLYGRKPLQSVFTRDCIERGRDLDDGGARYNWVECSFVGLANFVDSLHVLREEVFQDKRMSLTELRSVLDANFEGHEEVRLRLLQQHAKYGQDCPEVDALFQDTVAYLQTACAKYKMEPDGSPYVPGAFCWIMHEALGRQCGATPDGRMAGFPFADGCGPAQGRETMGPTAGILSTTSWDHSPMIGGLAYNMKFNSRLFERREGLVGLRNLLLTFLQRGGFETQINVVDADTLRKAQANPDAYRDLVVRIGGYCDYFTRLSPEMQAEVILRTEFAHV